MRYQYIFFDLDGTLTDPREGITKSVQYALRHMGIEEPDLAKLEPFIGPPLLDSFQEYYDFLWSRQERRWKYYREVFLAGPACIRMCCWKEYRSFCSL